MGSNIEVWADYAKDRFESAAKRVDEFRNWARQLSAAVAVVIGLELTLVAKVLELKPPFDTTLRGRCLIAFLVAVGIQLLLIWWLLFVGYFSLPIRYPESPVVLATYVLNQDAQETQRMIGAYYAKAYDRFHRSVQKTRHQGWHRDYRFCDFDFSVFCGCACMGTLGLHTPDLGAYTWVAMSDPAPETPSAAPAPADPTPLQPSAAAPVDQAPTTTENPLLVTPTEGDLGKLGEAPRQEADIHLSRPPHR